MREEKSFSQRAFSIYTDIRKLQDKTKTSYTLNTRRLRFAMNNSLAEVHPELVFEWSEKNLPLTPDDITFGSNKKIWWKGACGHEWKTSVKARSNGEKCPICSGARVIAGINDLQTTHPEIASEWSEKNLPLKPDEVNAKSRKNVWWRCGKCGNEWKSVISEFDGKTYRTNSYNKVLDLIYQQTNELRGVEKKNGESFSTFSASVPLTVLFSNQFLHDLDLIWELREWIPI